MINISKMLNHELNHDVKIVVTDGLTIKRHYMTMSCLIFQKQIHNTIGKYSLSIVSISFKADKYIVYVTLTLQHMLFWKTKNEKTRLWYLIVRKITGIIWFVASGPCVQVLNITANTTFHRGDELQGSGLSKKSLSEKKCRKKNWRKQTSKAKPVSWKVSNATVHWYQINNSIANGMVT